MRGNELFRVVMAVRMLGRRAPRNPCIGMLDELIKNDTYGAMKQRSEDRSAWRI